MQRSGGAVNGAGRHGLRQIAPLYDACAAWFQATGAANDLLDLFGGRPPGLCTKEVLAVWEGGRLCGVVDMVRGYPDPTGWFIGLVLLHPEVRGHGLGARVVAQLETMARSGGGTHIGIGVLFTNPDGRRFWERVGYRVTDARRPPPGRRRRNPDRLGNAQGAVTT